MLKGYLKKKKKLSFATLLSKVLDRSGASQCDTLKIPASKK